MTANDSTPTEGQESTDRVVVDHPATEGLSDEEVAQKVRKRRWQAFEKAQPIIEALENEDVPLTDEKVGEFWEVADSISLMSEALACRVPPEHRTDRPDR
jgi:hypothetical protein